MQMLRSKHLIKALIFWAYDIFPEQEWCIKDIVIAEKCEIALMNSYNQSKKSAKHKQSKSGQWRDKYLLSKKQVSKKQVIDDHDVEEKKAPKHKKQSKSGQWRDKYLLSKKQFSKKHLDEVEKKVPEKDDPPPITRATTSDLSPANTTKIVSHFKNPSLSANNDLNLTDIYAENNKKPLQRSYTVGHADMHMPHEEDDDTDDMEDDILFDLWDNIDHDEAETIITSGTAEKKQKENVLTNEEN
eukprot:UN04814